MLENTSRKLNYDQTDSEPAVQNHQIAPVPLNGSPNSITVSDDEDYNEGADSNDGGYAAKLDDEAGRLCSDQDQIVRNGPYDVSENCELGLAPENQDRTPLMHGFLSTSPGHEEFFVTTQTLIRERQ